MRATAARARRRFVLDSDLPIAALSWAVSLAPFSPRPCPGHTQVRNPNRPNPLLYTLPNRGHVTPMRIAPRLLAVAFVVLFAAALAGCDPGTPEASFTAAPSEGRAPLTVQFTDTSENSPESWAWDFGDGASSTEQSPIHTYASTGTYDVALVASNDDGSSTAEVSRAITVGPGELTAVRLSDDALAIQVGGAHAVSVLAVDAFGNEITDADVSWSLAAGGSVDATGTVTAGTVAGYFDDALTVTVVGGSMTLTASASLTVLPGPLASADFSLTEFAAGETRQLSATAHDRHGNVIDDAEVQWTAASGGAIDDWRRIHRRSRRGNVLRRSRGDRGAGRRDAHRSTWRDGAAWPVGVGRDRPCGAHGRRRRQDRTIVQSPPTPTATRWRPSTSAGTRTRARAQSDSTATSPLQRKRARTRPPCASS